MINKLKELCIIIVGLPFTIYMISLDKLIDVLNDLYFYSEIKVSKIRRFLVKLLNYDEEN